MPTALALAALLQACAPRVGPRTLTAIISVESGGNPNAIHDNTSGLSYFPSSAERATDLAVSLVAAGHSVDLGISQINSMNLPGLALSVADMFDPCTNVRVSAQILTGDYRRAVAQFGPGQVALRHAIGAYNTGSIYAGSSYVSLVLAAAGARRQRSISVIAEVPQRSAQHRIHIYQPHTPAAVRPIPENTDMNTERADFSIEATAE